MGPHEGQASLYEWRWQYSAPALLVWLALIAAMAGIKANRDRRTFWILIPLAIVNLLYLLLKKVTSMPSSSAIQFDLLFQSLAIGVMLLWLVAPALGRYPGVRRGLVAFVLLMVVAALGMLSYGSAPPDETTIFLVLLGFLALVLVLALIAATRSCRRVYRPGHFMAWLAVWMALGGAIGMLGSYVVILGVLSSGPDASQLPLVILMAGLMGLVLGLCLYVLNLPFMLLGFASPFFRTRLQACLNLRRPEDATAPGGVGDEQAPVP
jgi:MFS family permease